MASIDERVVAMSFESTKFEANVAKTMATLNKLDATIANMGKVNGLQNLEAQSHKVTLAGPIAAVEKLGQKLGLLKANTAAAFADMEKASNKVTLQGPISALDKLRAKLGMTTASSTFAEMESAANRVTFSGLGQAIEGVAGKFSMLKTAASVALGGIAAQLATQFASMAKNLSLGPAIAGFQEYATNLNSIQTILANTSAKGTTLKDVSRSLQELNTYSDQTIYNFGQMANAIGLFTAAGVDLNTSVDAIKGIANLAALSGSNADQATHAMQQLSQAVAAGKVTMQDWISVRNAGLGGEVFQKALFDTAKALGTLKNVPMGQTFEEWKRAGNSFTKSLSETQKEGVNTAKVMSKARKDAAELVKDAEQSAADSIEAATKRVKDSQESAAEDITNAAQRVKDAQESSAEAIANAAQKVKDAQKSAGDAAKQSAEDIQNAQIAQRDTFRQSAEDVKSALDDVKEARRQLIEAMKPPSADELQAASDRLKTAQLDQADLAGAVTDAQKEQKRAAEDLASAQERLAQIRRTGSASEIQAAQRAVEDAQTRVTDSADAVERAQIRQRDATRGVNDATRDLTETQKKGTKEDQKVIDARDALTSATTKYRDIQKKADQDNRAAAQAVADARKKGAEQQRIAGEKLAEAEKDQAKTIIEARKSVADAERDQAKTIIKANESVADAEKDQVKAVKDAREQIAKAHEQAAERISAARDSLKKKDDSTWLTSEVLTKTLAQFTGDLSKAQLQAMGFTDEQIKAIQQMAKTAKASATEVKTLTQVFAIAKETAGSGWAKTFQIIFGSFEEAKGTFTDLSNTINGFVNANANARNKVLEDWKKLGGRTELIEGIKKAFEGIAAVLKPIKDAFRDVFPRKTGQDLLDMTKNFRDLMDTIRPSPETVDNLRRTFKGFFGVLEIGWTIIKNVAGVIGDLFKAISGGHGGFLDFTAAVGDFLFAIDEAVTKGDAFSGIFDSISAVLQVPLIILRNIAGAIKGLFDGADQKKGEGFSTMLEQIDEALKPLGGSMDKVKDVWDGFVEILDRIKKAVEPAFTAILNVLGDFGNAVGTAFENIDWDKAINAVQTGLLGGILYQLRNLFKGGIHFDFGGGLFKQLNDTFKVLEGNLEAIQRNIQANTLLQIAAAIAVLAAGVYILSTIDAKKLSKAMTAVAVGLGELIGGMKFLTMGAGKTAFLQMPFMAASLVILATSIVILAGAMKIMATMSWEDIAKGLVGLGGALVVLSDGMKLMNGPKLMITALAMIPLAIGIAILASAIKIMSSMSWEEIGKGLAGLAGALVAVGGGVALIGPSILLIGPGMIAMAIGLTILSGALRSFGEMDPIKMAKGILGMGASIVVLAGAISLFPPGMLFQALALRAIASAMDVLGQAIEQIGNLDISTMIKGIAGIAAVMLVLAGGLYLMQGTIGGSVALLAAAAAFAVLAPTMKILGSMKISTIVKALVAMAAVLAVLAIAGAVASGPLMALGLAMAVLGAGMLVISAALSLFVLALAQLGEKGPKSIAALVAAFGAFLLVLPKMMIDFAKGMLEVAKSFIGLAPTMAKALASILVTVADTIKTLAPKLADALHSILLAVQQIVRENLPILVGMGFNIINAILQGIRDNMPQLVATIAGIITAFLTALQAHAPDLSNAGGNLIVAFLKGIGGKVPDILNAAVDLIIKFASALAGQVPKITAEAVKLMVKFLASVVGYVPKMITAGANIIIKFIEGIGKKASDLVKKGTEVAGKFLNAVSKALVKLTNVGFQAIIDFLHGIADAIRKNTKPLIDAGADILDALIDGVVQAAGRMGPVLKRAIEKLFSLLPGWAKKILGISSPSKVFMDIGLQTIKGFAVGYEKGADDAQDTVNDTTKALFMRMPQFEDYVDTNPRITPVLDLSQATKDAANIPKIITDTVPLSPTLSTDYASRISTLTEDQANLQGEATPRTQITYTQNNYSPDPISNIELYRQTNNQLAQIKSSVGVK